MPFKMCRRRFVIKIAFDMAISKAQVQTHKSLAVYPLLSALFPMARSTWNFLDPLHFYILAVTISEGHQKYNK